MVGVDCLAQNADDLLWLSLLLYFILLLLLFIQTLFSEVTERIPFILSHNIRSRCNLIMPSQKFVELYPTEKSPKNPKNRHFRDRVRH